MQRYPSLTIYRWILIVLGWLTIVGGVIIAISLANLPTNVNPFTGEYSSSGFNLTVFFTTAIPFIIGGGGLLVISAIISLFVNIETRLIEIRDVYQQTGREGKSESRSSAHVSTSLSSSSSVPAPAQPKPDTSALEQLARGQRVRFEGVVTSERVALRLQPNRESVALRAALLGQEVGVMAQNTDGTWLLVIVDGKPYWMLGKGISAEGDTSTLPIVG